MKSDSLRNISGWKAWVAFTGFMAFSPIALMAETSVESIYAVQQHQVINGVVVDASGEAILVQMSLWKELLSVRLPISMGIFFIRSQREKIKFLL